MCTRREKAEATWSLASPAIHGIRRAASQESPVFPTRVAETCSLCHANAETMKGVVDASGRQVPVDQYARWKRRVHAVALLEKGDLSAPTCNDCHGNHGATPPGIENVSFTCGQCHGREAALFRASAKHDKFAEHNELLKDAEQGCSSCHENLSTVTLTSFGECVTCHENHAVIRPTVALLGNVPETPCAFCHEPLKVEVDVDAIGKGEIDKFKSSMDKVRSHLRPIKEFVKKFTLYFDSNPHIDAAWLWREKETIEVCNNTFTSVFNIMDQKPGFTYTQSAAQYYKWMEDLYPDVFRGIQRKMEIGRWEAIGGMWIEPDCNLIDGVSWMRQLLYAKKYFKNKLGVNINIGWNPDSFGYNWNMPMFYQNAGIDAFITQKIGWNETRRTGDRRDD